MIKVHDILLVSTNELMGLPATIEVQVDEVLYGDDYDKSVLIGYSTTMVDDSSRLWLVLPEEVVGRFLIN